MNKLQTTLQGKKTYAVGIILALYGIGAYFGLWQFDLKVAASIGGTGLVTLAAKVERLLSDTSAQEEAPTVASSQGIDFKKGVNLLALLLLPSVLLYGCASQNARLEVGGSYAPASFQVSSNLDGTLSTNVVQTIAPDFAFYAADASFDLAYSSLDGVFKFERDNRKMLWQISPEIKHGLDKIRPVAWQVVQRYVATREAYRANPTPMGLSLLQDAASKMQALTSAAQAATSLVTTNR